MIRRKLPALSLALIALSVFTLSACGGSGGGPAVETPEEVTKAATRGPVGESEIGEQLTSEEEVEIDIGDVTYGVYAGVEIRQEQPNLKVHRLASPRFTNRTQLLTIDVSEPVPQTLPLTIISGATRYLWGHTVFLKVHTYREFKDESGATVKEEVLTFDRVLGDRRFADKPDFVELDAFEGLEKLPSTMLIYCELEAWLFLRTEVETFDPEKADFESADYKRYPGYNPARINLPSAGSEE